jgi:pimeloyl-ACP methyl ester carboxylesterase
MPDGRALDVWVEGEPTRGTLLFIFGTPSSGLPSRAEIRETAARGLQLVTWSRPGYGDSTRQPGRSVADLVPDAVAILDALDVDRAWVAGWSGGGPHALACAALVPDRVIAAASLAGLAPYGADGLDWLAGMGAENIEEFNAALEGPEALIDFKERAWPIFRDVTGAEVGAAFGDLVDHVDLATTADPEFGEDLAALLREGLRSGYWGWFDDDMAFTRPWGFDLASIRGPVHIWQGAHDRMVPFAHGEWLARHVGGAVPHLFPGHGHLSLVVGEFAEILDSLVEAGS